MSDEPKWIVRRFNWRQLMTTSEGTRYIRLPGAITVAEFDDPHDADADCAERERAVRANVNPFRCGFDLADFTHMPAYAFQDYLMDDSVRPAKYDSTAQIRWDKWWEKHSSGWNFDRRGRIWEALDKVRFFEVIERTADRELFVVVEAVADFSSAIWTRRRYIPSEYGTEGGRPVRAFLSRQDADAYLELAVEETNTPPRTQLDTDPFTHPETLVRLPADRVWDVPLGGDLPSLRPTVFVVCRVGLARSTSYNGLGWQFDDYPTGEVRWADGHPDFDVFPTQYEVRRPRLVPEAAFTDREAAEANALVRERPARRCLNPLMIHEFLRSHGSNPERQAREWAANYANAPDAEHDQAWSAFPHHSLYHVIEIEMED